MTVGVRDGERKEEIRAMSEENKALARRYLEEVWDKGNVDLIDELFTTDFVRHGPPLSRERCVARRVSRA